eukprot:jgi/Undpi1/5960/HiC_scaffold_2.g01234.m1
MIFRVAGTADNVRLCFSLVNQDANAQGCGLPRRLVERMPVVPGDEVRVLPCFHRFHVDEIDDWLDRNMTCPLCHLDINKALTGSSGTAFVRAVEGNPTGVIERTRKRK